MTQVDWNDSLLVDLPTIDEQHKKLIAMSNSLIGAMVNGMGHSILETLFDEMLGYTVYHFEDEEAFMEQIGYPHLDAHKIVHERLKKDVLIFRKKLLTDEVSPEDALTFINNWIVKHIQQMDIKISEFAKTQQA